MSGAACQACVVGIAHMPNGVGTVGEPFGTCNNCGSFACGFHGTRDKNVPELICAECDISLLAASAATTIFLSPIPPPPSPPPPASPPRPPHPPLPPELSSFAGDMLTGYHLRWLPPSSWAFRSIEDFEVRRPGYSRDMLPFVRATTAKSFEIKDNQMRVLWRACSPTAKELLVMATVLIQELKIPEGRLRPVIVSLSRAFPWEFA
jgi:hypothetical protein